MQSLADKIDATAEGLEQFREKQERKDLSELRIIKKKSSKN